MNPLEAALRGITQRLADLHVAYALVGGLAVSARADPRTTRDVDLALAVEDDAEAERIVFQLVDSGAYVVAAVVEQTAVKRLATIRLRPTDETTRGALVDLLFASSGIEREVVEGAEALEILPHLVLPVATARHLVAMKLLARDDRRRPQDHDDLRVLLAQTTADDVDEVRRLLGRIEALGFARGRDLGASLDEILSEGR